MASVDIDLVINTANGANSVKDIRTQLKALKNAMLEVGEDSAEFNRLAQAAAELEDKMGDVNERMAAFNPDGFAALTGFANKAVGAVGAVTGAMALFGAENEELQKSMLKVQAAMQMTQGIESIKGLGKAFKALWAVVVANPIVALVTALAALGTAAYAVYNSMTQTSEATEKANAEYEAQKKVTSQLVQQYEHEIAILEAQGASVEDIIAAKRKLIEAQIDEIATSIMARQQKIKDIETNNSLWESILEVASATAEAVGNEKAAEGGRALIAENKAERAEEEMASLEQEMQALRDLQNQIKVLDVEEEKAYENKRENAQKTYETKKELSEKEEAEWLAHLTAIAQAEENARQEKLKREQELYAKLEELRIADRERRDKQLDAEQAEVDKFREMFSINQKAKSEEAAAFAKDLLDRGLINFVEYSAAILQIQKETDAARQASQLELAGATISILSSLAGFAKQGSKAQKSLALTQIAAETAVGFIKGLVVAQTAAAGTGPAAAFAFPIFYTQQIAAVLAAAKKAKDMLQSGSSGGGTSVPSLGMSGGIAAINTPPAQPQPSTQLDQNGNVIGGNGNQSSAEPMRVYVLESDITRTQNRVALAEAMVTHR